MCVVVCCCCCPQTVFPFRFWSSPHLGDFKKVALFSFFIIFSSLLFFWPYDSHHRPRSFLSFSLQSLLYLVPCMSDAILLAPSRVLGGAHRRDASLELGKSVRLRHRRLWKAFSHFLFHEMIYLNKIIITMIIIRKILIEICGVFCFCLFFGTIRECERNCQNKIKNEHSRYKTPIVWYPVTRK